MWWTIFIAAVIAVGAAVAVISIVRRRRRGKYCCGDFSYCENKNCKDKKQGGR